MTIKSALAALTWGENLSAAQAEEVMEEIMSGGASEAQIAGLLIALQMKGETVEEMTGFARSMRKNVVPVPSRHPLLLDVCGTGGDGHGTFNISTAAAIVIAAAGVPVAKHGNRSVSSKCGSADVLEQLGVRFDLSPEEIGRCIDEVGIGFLYAPHLHPAMRHAIRPRREMGVRTVFNILGPLTNPAGANVQLLGVYRPGLTDVMARVLRSLGCQAAFVVHGGDGLDELSTTESNRVTQLQDGEVRTFTLDPRVLRLPPASLSDLQGGDAEVNAAIMTQILAGERGAKRDVVLLNAAYGLVLGRVVADPGDGLDQAAQAIDSGAAQETLASLVAFTQERSGKG